VRLIGKIGTINEIEKEIKEHAMSILTKDRPNSLNSWFGTDASLYTKKFDVLIPDTMYTFAVRLLYDERSDKGGIRVKDKDIWWLCKVCPRMLKLLAELDSIEEPEQVL
jgi:hypothetical protein